MRGIFICLGGLVLANVTVALCYQQRHAKTSPARTPASAKYTVEKLVLPPKTRFYHGAAATNALGQVVASFMPEGKPLQAVLWNRGTYTPLGVLGGRESVPFDINDQTQIVGWSDTNKGMQHAFLWEQGTLRDLGVAAGFAASAATAINDNGWIVGRSFTQERGPYWSWPCHATLWKDGKLYDLGVPDDCVNSRATAINNRGQITGWATNKDEQMTAVLWENGRWINLGKQTGKAVSSGNTIDAQGRVLGTAGDSNNTMRGVLWEGNKTTFLPALPYHSSNRLAAAGPAGVVYGDSKVGWEWGPALSWQPGSSAPTEIDQQLGPHSDWFLVHIFDVNPQGQVLAFGSTGNTVDCLALLTPILKTEAPQ